jgi:hypothetical protein
LNLSSLRAAPPRILWLSASGRILGGHEHGQHRHRKFNDTPMTPAALIENIVLQPTT